MKQLRTITAAFILITLLPVGYIVYELSSLNKNEQIIKTIYKNQLDAILFSVNQYSEDAMSSWANRVNLEVTSNKEVSDETLSTLLTQQNSIKGVLLMNLEGGHRWIGIHPSAVEIKNFDAEIKSGADRNRVKIERLRRYYEAGFKKMEPIDSIISSDQYVPVFFALADTTVGYSVGAMIIDLPEFIRSTLGPKMQAISQEQFVIAAFREGTDSLVYSTGSVRPGGTNIDQEIVKQGERTGFWLLPGYYVGIVLKGATVDDLVRTRTSSSLIILCIVLVLLLGGLLFVYRSIRKEIALAEAKSQFVSNVSHEIRTPLSLISMYAETLEMNRVPEGRKQEYYSILVKESARLSRLVNRILNFSQADANKKKFTQKETDLNELVGEVLASYEIQLQEKGFSYQFSPSESTTVIRADREAIVEVIINLLDNAMKYSHDRKRITLRTMRDDRFVILEVEDEGIGISKAHHHAIFDQFFRVPTGDIHNTKGSGLGLSLAKKTMEAHGGKIKVESELGRGSVFRLYFPLDSPKG